MLMATITTITTKTYNVARPILTTAGIHLRRAASSSSTTGGWNIGNDISTGKSMEPAIKEGARIIVNPNVDPNRIQRGDVVGVWSPVDSDVVLCKRVTKLPGDHLTLPQNVSNHEMREKKKEAPPPWVSDASSNGSAWKNEETPSSPPPPPPPPRFWSKREENHRSVPSGHVWVENDNKDVWVDDRVRIYSRDSHDFGPVSIDSICCQVMKVEIKEEDANAIMKVEVKEGEEVVEVKVYDDLSAVEYGSLKFGPVPPPSYSSMPPLKNSDEES